MGVKEPDPKHIELLIPEGVTRYGERTTTTEMEMEIQLNRYSALLDPLFSPIYRRCSKSYGRFFFVIYIYPGNHQKILSFCTSTIQFPYFFPRRFLFFIPKIKNSISLLSFLLIDMRTHILRLNFSSFYAAS